MPRDCFPGRGFMYFRRDGQLQQLLGDFARLPREQVLGRHRYPEGGFVRVSTAQIDGGYALRGPPTQKARTTTADPVVCRPPEGLRLG